MSLENKNKQAFIKSKNTDWHAVEEGVERKILGYDEQIMMVAVRFVKGAVGSMHHHPHRQVSYVSSGRFEVTIGGQKEILEPGDSFFVSPELEHGVVALDEGELIDVFSPARETFL